MERIQFFYTPMDLSRVQVRPNYDPQNDFLRILTESDRQKIELNWKEALKRTQIWRGELGSLVDTQEGNLQYAKTDYGVWRAIASPDLHPEYTTLSDLAYDKFRVSSVGIAVETIDGKVIVHRKPDNVPAGGKLDSSANGFCEVKNGQLDFGQAAYEKLERELKLTKEEILNLELRGVHSVVGKGSYCNSGMLAYHAKTKLPFEEIKQKANGSYIADLISVEKGDLANFIVTHYADGSLIGDGCATLLASLDHKDFSIAVHTLRDSGKVIEFGFLRDGEFIPKPLENIVN